MQKMKSLRHVGPRPAAKLNMNIHIAHASRGHKKQIVLSVFFFKCYRSMVMDQEQNKLCAVCETNLCRDALLWLKIFTSTKKLNQEIALFSVYYRNGQKNRKDTISQSGYAPPHVTLFFFLSI